MTRDLEATTTPLQNATPTSDTPQSNEKPTETVSRRSFITKTAATAAAFTIAPRHVLGRGYTPPSDLLNIAGVGVGGMGHTNLINCSDQNIVALCDPDAVSAANMFQRYEKATKYTDFRKMLDKEQKNIDAVIIAIPDHMHGMAALWAMERGKHVYVEKPLTTTPWEARLLHDAAGNGSRSSALRTSNDESS